MTAPTPPPTDERDPGLSPRVRVVLITVALGAVALGLLLLHPDAEIFDRSHLLMACGVAVGFAVSERLIFHVEARSEAVSYTPSELVLAIGLLYLNPAELLGARILGSCIGSVIWRRPPLFKLAFNLASFALETVLAVLIVRALGVLGDGLGQQWLSVAGGVAIATVVGGIMVASAIAQFEGGLRPKVLAEIRNSPIFYLPPSLMAASIAVLLTVDPWLAFIAASPAPVVWYVVRSHGALLHRYGDLSTVHDFSRVVGDATSLQQLASAAAQRIAEASRAAHVEIRLTTASGTADAVVGAGPDGTPGLAGLDESTWTLLLDTESLHRVPSEDHEEFRRAFPTIRNGLVGSIRDERGVVGAILMSDRQGASPVFDADDVQRVGTMLSQLAVAVRKAQFQNQIQHDATHDRLTGLPNRTFFQAWAAQEILSGAGAVFMIDLDRFKQVNDAFGHHVGDALLAAAAERIRARCGPADLAARFGGDEFAVFVPAMDEAEAALFAENLAAELDRPFELEPATIVLTSSIGVALAPRDGTDIAVLLRRADAAMYDAKSRRSRTSFYRDELEEDDTTKLLLLRDLREALENGTLEVHYQPQLDLATGRISGAEALARWTHPEHGSISPEVFVGLAEHAGLIGPLTRLVLRTAVDAAAEWQRRGWDLTLSVNISAQSLHDEQLEPLVADELRRSALDPRRLCLEITETTMMSDPERTHRILRRLSALGISLSVDDFGTGYSSLVNLRHLPVDELKIDRSFVTEMRTEQNDDVIVRSTIDLGHNLGLVVVAEGVEDSTCLERLRELGCDIAQGFFISRPVAHDEFRRFIAAHRDPSPGIEVHFDEPSEATAADTH